MEGRFEVLQIFKEAFTEYKSNYKMYLFIGLTQTILLLNDLIHHFSTQKDTLLIIFIRLLLSLFIFIIYMWINIIATFFAKNNYFKDRQDINLVLNMSNKKLWRVTLNMCGLLAIYGVVYSISHFCVGFFTRVHINISINFISVITGSLVISIWGFSILIAQLENDKYKCFRTSWKMAYGNILNLMIIYLPISIFYELLFRMKVNLIGLAVWQIIFINIIIEIINSVFYSYFLLLGLISYYKLRYKLNESVNLIS